MGLGRASCMEWPDHDSDRDSAFVGEGGSSQLNDDVGLPPGMRGSSTRVHAAVWRSKAESLSGRGDVGR